MKTRHDPASKPYFRCLSCPEFRHSCAGLPTRDMSLPEWCEYIRDVMELAHLTNSYVANAVGVSVKTVERIRAIADDIDIMRETARMFELVVVGTAYRTRCYLDCEDTERIIKLQAEVDYWKKENDRKAKIIDKYLD